MNSIIAVAFAATAVSAVRISTITEKKVDLPTPPCMRIPTDAQAAKIFKRVSGGDGSVNNKDMMKAGEAMYKFAMEHLPHATA